MAADRQTDIHTTSANAVTLVWGSLRLAPMIAMFYFTREGSILKLYT